MPTRTGILVWIMAVILVTLAFAVAFAAEPAPQAQPKPPTRDELLVMKGANLQLKETTMAKVSEEIRAIDERVKNIDEAIAKMDGSAKASPDKPLAKTAEKAATK